MIIGGKDFSRSAHTYIMGILNVTPDSFSDGGKWNQLDQAFYHVEEMLASGMDILDIGGESTRPGYTKLSDEEEIARVLPFLEGVKKRFDVPISLDTYKSKVAEAGIWAGADLINDIWGLKYDSKMAQVIAENQVSCCLMHNRANTEYKSFLPEVISDLQESLEIANKAGIEKDRIMLDPGVGFAKSYEQNLQLINNLEEFTKLGFPVLLGTSRKSVIGLTLDLPVTEREEGTRVTTVMAVEKGCRFVRVHDVEKTRRAILMAEAILQSGTV